MSRPCRRRIAVVIDLHYVLADAEGVGSVLGQAGKAPRHKGPETRRSVA